MRLADLQRANEIVSEIRTIENALSLSDEYDYYISFYGGAAIEPIIVENDCLETEIRGYLHARLEMLRGELDKL